MDENTELAALADEIYTMAGRMIEEGNKPFAVAAVFTMIALQIYKTSLSEEDYQGMVDSISENRNQIKSLPEMLKNINLTKFH